MACPCEQERFQENPVIGGTGLAIAVGSLVGLFAYLALRSPPAATSGAPKPVPAKTLAGIYVQTFCVDAITQEETSGPPLRLADLLSVANASVAVDSAFQGYVASPLALRESFRVFAADLPLEDPSAQMLALRETRPLFCRGPAGAVLEIKTLEADGTIARRAIVTGVSADGSDVQAVFDALPKTVPTAVFLRDPADAQRLVVIRSTNGFENVPTAGSGVVVPITF